MDRRDLVNFYHSPWKNINEKRMVGTFVDLDDEEHEVKMAYEVCPTCEGKGKHVNPSIDSHGLSYEDFREDPGFAEDYCSGFYDITCNQCAGKRVVTVIDEEYNSPEIIEMVRDTEKALWENAREYLHEREMGY